MEELLKNNGLKRTKLRVALLDCFVAAKHALSYADLKAALGPEVDKSTLYRNLTAFEAAGLIHRINDQSGVGKYALGKPQEQGHGHAHFVCEQCSTVYCVAALNPQEIKVPKGFKTKEVQTIIKGVCAAC